MKKYKIIILLFFIILSFNITKAYAKAFSYKWENTNVKIRVGSNIEDYKDVPRAKLYIDGILASDAKRWFFILFKGC